MTFDRESMDASTESEPRTSGAEEPMDGVEPSVVAPLQPVLSPVSSFTRSSSSTSQLAGAAPPAPAAAYMGPPTGTEIAFSFDTTGSMSSCLEEVQNNLKTIINRLLMDIPALKIAIIAHGDYCDQEHFYVTKTVDFTNDVNALFDFVTNCGGTGGGDYEECYELVLKKIREELSWSPGTTKSMVMIGDAIPHPPGHGGNTDLLDWKEEIDRLYGELGVRGYAVQCMVGSNKEAVPFWQELSKRSFGKYLEMNQFETVVDLMMAICYKEGGNPAMFEAYEREVRAREGRKIGRDLDLMFTTLRDGEAAAPSKAVAKVRPIKKVTVAKKATPKAAPQGKRKPAAAPARTPKPRSPAKTIPKRTPKRNTAPKQTREGVHNGNYALNALRWSAWKRYEAPGSGQRLSPVKKDAPTVYEVAVQTHAFCPRHVVFFSTTKGVPRGVNCDTYLFRKPYIREQLKSVLDQSARVFVRWATLPKSFKIDGETLTAASQVSTILRRKYDFAWMKNRRQTKVPGAGREVVRRGIVISRHLDL